jgi:hypothetical protein
LKASNMMNQLSWVAGETMENLCLIAQPGTKTLPLALALTGGNPQEELPLSILASQQPSFLHHCPASPTNTIPASALTSPPSAAKRLPLPASRRELRSSLLLAPCLFQILRCFQRALPSAQPRPSLPFLRRSAWNPTSPRPVLRPAVYKHPSRPQAVLSGLNLGSPRPFLA